MFIVRPVDPSDTEAWLRMRCALWPDGSEAEHRGEITAFLGGNAREPAAVFLAEDDGGRPLGIVELSIRPCAEGCLTNRIGYLEGWYVVPEARRHGVGRALVEAAQEWARGEGCTELASDTQPDNAASIAAHRSLGFEDVGLVRCFRQDL
jgi:aminoglycoside 6'-N-acetyltransferase I